MAGDSGMGFLQELSERTQSLKLGRGVLGKVGSMVVTLLLVWAAIVFRLDATAAWEFNALLLVAGGVATGLVMYALTKMIGFAEQNPGAALLEGAHLLHYQRIEAQAKGLLSADTSEPTEGPKPGPKIVVKDPQEPIGHWYSLSFRVIQACAVGGTVI